MKNGIPFWKTRTPKSKLTVDSDKVVDSDTAYTSMFDTDTVDKDVYL